MNLKPRFLLFTALLFGITAVAVSVSVRSLAENIIEQWAPRYIIKQTLYDKSRILQPILTELALSKQLASSSLIKEWAHSPDDADLTQKALQELENYRQNFRDNNFFVSFLSNGHYYHNNAKNEYLGNEYRYTLERGKEADSWFFNIIDQKRDIHINVNPDVELGVTKLWLDILIKDGEQILGMAGTGLDLTEFLDNVLNEQSEKDVHSLFVNHFGAIQLHRNKDLIDFGTISKNTKKHKTIDLIFENQEDRYKVYQAMSSLEAGKEEVITSFVNVFGQRQLMGIIYLPEIDWYEITLIDISALLPISEFSKIILLFIITLLITLFILNFGLTTLVLTPISQLNRAMDLFAQGKKPVLKERASGEMKQLINHFEQMATSVQESKDELEKKVRDRTADLERLVQIDPLTELYNRRGMTTKIENHLNTRDDKYSIGLLWIDVDWFKEINDTYGHSIGDDALIAVANIIKSSISDQDLAARWGGDEFLVFLNVTDTEKLTQVAQHLRAKVESHQFEIKKLHLSISIGGTISNKGHNINNLLHDADVALYQAKENGRNCFYLADTTQTHKG